MTGRDDITAEPRNDPRRRSRDDLLWRVIIISIFAIGVVMAVGFPLLNGNWRSLFAAMPVFAFGILIAAIRSIRR